MDTMLIEALSTKDILFSTIFLENQSKKKLNIFQKLVCNTNCLNKILNFKT